MIATRLPRSREEAMARGAKRYFTGELCINGHRCERLVSGSRCVECYWERRRVAVDKTRVKEAATRRVAVDKPRVKEATPRRGAVELARDTSLTELWKDLSLTVDAIASRLDMGTRSVVYYHAKRLNLPPRRRPDRRVYRGRTRELKPVSASPREVVPVEPKPVHQWPDGWSLRQPTKAELMGGGSSMRSHLSVWIK